MNKKSLEDISFKYTIGIGIISLVGMFIINGLMSGEWQWRLYGSMILSYLITTPFTYYFINDGSFKSTKITNLASIMILNLPISILIAIGFIMVVF